MSNTQKIIIYLVTDNEKKRRKLKAVPLFSDMEGRAFLQQVDYFKSCVKLYCVHVRKGYMEYMVFI